MQNATPSYSQASTAATHP